MKRTYIRVSYQNKVRYGLREGKNLYLMRDSVSWDPEPDGEMIHLSEVDRILPPFQGGKILGIGRNYRRPEFTENDIPAVPKVFLKSDTSIIQGGEAIVLTPMSRDVICEPEIAVMIRRPGVRIPLPDAMDYVAGYLVINDVTDRALLTEDGGEWTRGKSTDTFLPMGNEIIAGIDPFSLRVSCEINGRKSAEGNTRDMIFDIPHLVSFISHFMRLEAGDVVLTGTPEGVPIHPGDQVKIAVENVGEIENPVRYDDTNWNL